MPNKKLVWDKISQELADGGYSKKQKYSKIHDGNKKHRSALMNYSLKYAII